MAECGCAVEAGSAERRTLRLLLLLNAVMFVLELAVGWIGESTGLIADSLDMFADAGVYAAALWAVGSSARRKTSAAAASGIVQLVLAAGVVVEVARRWVQGSEPVSGLMIAVSGVALCVNAACVWLLRTHRHGEVHMRASWIFSTTDVQANLGVIAAGVLVMVTRSALPDLIVGLLVSGLVIRGGVRIIRDTRVAATMATGRQG